MVVQVSNIGVIIEIEEICKKLSGLAGRLRYALKMISKLDSYDQLEQAVIIAKDALTDRNHEND